MILLYHPSPKPKQFFYVICKKAIFAPGMVYSGNCRSPLSQNCFNTQLNLWHMLTETVLPVGSIFNLHWKCRVPYHISLKYKVHLASSLNNLPESPLLTIYKARISYMYMGTALCVMTTHNTGQLPIRVNPWHSSETDHNNLITKKEGRKTTLQSCLIWEVGFNIFIIWKSVYYQL